MPQKKNCRDTSAICCWIEELIVTFCVLPSFSILAWTQDYWVFQNVNYFSHQNYDWNSFGFFQRKNQIWFLPSLNQITLEFETYLIFLKAGNDLFCSFVLPERQKKRIISKVGRQWSKIENSNQKLLDPHCFPVNIVWKWSICKTGSFKNIKLKYLVIKSPNSSCS